MNIYEKLQSARVRLQSQEIKKSGHNKFAGYYYMELGDFLAPIQELFNEFKLCGVISFSSEFATLTIVDIDEPDKTIIINSPMGSAALKGCHEVQNIGAVETYQRRYLWITALEIVEHDALDALTGEDQPEKPSKKSPTKAEAQSVSTEADAIIIAKFNAAKTVQELVAEMNAVPQEDKKLYTLRFNERMTELKKGA